MSIRILRCLLRSCLPILVGSTCLLSQTPPSDPHAISLSSQSIAALTGGNQVSDVRLTANVTWTAGAEPESGTGVLLVKGPSESRVDLELSSGGTRTEIRNNQRGPTGKWVNPDGKSGKYAFHNCLTDPAWFFPALSSLANVADPRFVFSYIGEETWHGVSTKHLRVSQKQWGFKDTQRLSTVDFYLDPISSLVLGVAFKTHPDKDMNIEIATEVHLSDYRRVNGIQVPFNIQRLQNGAILLDIVVTAASFNTGLPDNTFDAN
jgi:hypothetical protein